MMRILLHCNRTQQAHRGTLSKGARVEEREDMYLLNEYKNN